MRVMMIHNYYQHRGGEDAVYEAEAALLEQHGHDVRREAFHSSDIPERRTMGQSIRLGVQSIWSRSAYRTISAAVDEFKPDVVHLHNTFPLLSPSIYRACRSAGAPTVQTLHNFRMLCANAILFRDGSVCEDCVGRRLTWPGIAHACYRDSRIATATVTAMQATHRALGTWRRDVDLYVALSDHSMGVFGRGGLPPEKLFAKPHFVEDFGMPSGDPRSGAVFVGRLTPEKGVNTLLEAWTHVRDGIRLTIIGDGPMAEDVRAAASANPNIEWLGQKRYGETMRVVGAASLLIFPSVWYETFGRTIVEAFSRGTPVLASNSGTARDLVTSHRTGCHFPTGDAHALAGEVNSLFETPEHMRVLGQRAREEYEARYTPAVGYENLIKCYERAIELRARG